MSLEHAVLTLQTRRFIYEATSFNELKAAYIGEEDLGFGSRGFTINLSEGRSNKPTTIEFRQHHGATDPTVIKWWVAFAAALVRYSYFLAQFDLEVRDYGDLMDTSLDPNRYSVMERYSLDNSILDVIGFPAEGKEHFSAMTRKWKNDYHDAERELDEWFILKRAASSRADGNYTGRDFDAKLKEGQEYAAECERLQAKYNLSTPLVQKFIAKH